MMYTERPLPSFNDGFQFFILGRAAAPSRKLTLKLIERRKETILWLPLP